MYYFSPLQKWSFFASAFAVSVLIVGFVISAFYLRSLISAAPELEPYEPVSDGPVVFDTNGQELGQLAEEERSHVSIEEVPRHLQQALIATEDRRFREHRGVDLHAIARAIIRNIRAGAIVQGASTITQQLARTLYLDQDRTLERKLTESYLALKMERRYEKSEILEMYLNEAYFGAGATGVEAAAQRYFDVSVEDLSLPQSALLVGVLSSPVNRNPFSNPDGAISRRDAVLTNMVEAGFLSPREAETAQQVDPQFAEAEVRDEPGQAFIAHIRDELVEEFGAERLYNNELEIHTTLDADMQQNAEDTVDESFDEGVIPTVEDNDEPIDSEQPQPALVSIDSTTGAVRAMVGGRGNDGFNRAAVTERQPGSALKPFVYSAAFSERNYHPGTVVNDMPMYEMKHGPDEGSPEDGDSSARRAVPPDEDTPIEVWPRNFDNKYYGLISLRDALARSLNVPAVQLAREVGIETVFDHTREFGISTFGDEDGRSDHYSFALGGLEHGVTPLEMASAYGVFANQGKRATPHMIERIEDEEGETIFEVDVDLEPVISRAHAYLMRDMLHSVVETGTGSRAGLPDRPVAGKTGTTDLHTDGWFIGFADETVTSVWIGEDRAVPMVYDQDEDEQEYERTSAGGDFEVLGVHASEVWRRYWMSVQETRREKTTAEEVAAELVSESVETEREHADPLTDILPETGPDLGQADHVDRGAVRELTEDGELEPLFNARAGFSWRFRPEGVEEITIDAHTGVPASVFPDHAEVRPREEIALQESGFELLARVPAAAAESTLKPLFDPDGHLFEDAEPFGYRTGPSELQLGGRENVETSGGRPFEGVYYATEGEPVQYLDPGTRLPLDPARIRFEPEVQLLSPEPIPRALSMGVLPQTPR